MTGIAGHVSARAYLVLYSTFAVLRSGLRYASFPNAGGELPGGKVRVYSSVHLVQNWPRKQALGTARPRQALGPSRLYCFTARQARTLFTSATPLYRPGHPTTHVPVLAVEQGLRGLKGLEGPQDPLY